MPPGDMISATVTPAPCLRWVPAQAPDVYPFPTPVFPTTAALDRATQGAWVGKYGSEAYVLFGYDKGRGSNGTDRVHIPRGSFVKGFSPKCCNIKACTAPVSTWNADAAGLPAGTLLADPAGASKPPSLGFASCRSPLSGSPGTTALDVNTTAGERYQLALYMVGSAGDLSSQTTRLMDLQTLLCLLHLSIYTPIMATWRLLILTPIRATW